MRVPAVRLVLSVCTILALPFASGCGIERPEEPEQVILNISAVPSDVSCLRVTAAGPGRTTLRELEVTPGATLSESFSGLPLGAVEFKAEAFSALCDSVTKATIPGWVSDPIPVTIALGRLSSISLTMHRNGRAKVGIDWSDDAPDVGSSDVADAGEAF